MNQSLKALLEQEKLKTAIDAMWNLEGILTHGEIIKITGFLVGKKEGL